LSELNSRRRVRAALARRIGRFLGVSDLSSSVHALQTRAETQARDMDALRAVIDMWNSQIHQLTGRLDGLAKGESDLRLGLAVWTCTAYLAHLPAPEDALASVVLATHNRADLVSRAIESVISQSYRNWELIVIDDASEDDTPLVLRTFTDPRIRVLRREQPGGPSAARNTGLEEAKGEFVVYLDDDNVMYPHWLRGVAWAFDVHSDADVIVGARIIDDERRNQGLEPGGWPQLALPWFDRDRIAQESVSDLLQVAHRRDLPGARFDEQLTTGEDWDLLARLTQDRNPVVFPALAGIYTTSGSHRRMDTDLFRSDSQRVREKIAAMRTHAMGASEKPLSAVSNPHPIWEGQFTRWIAEGRATGRDPNDIGDHEWGSDRLDYALDAYYLPAARGARVVELGPGSGRLTRHLIEVVQHLTLLDASDWVCAWVDEYLSGHDNYEVHQITGAEAPMVPDASADAVFANGVVEHLDADQIYWFLREFHRILVPGGKVMFDFDNAVSLGGIEHLARSSAPGSRSIFRFHAPAAIVALAEAAGYDAKVDEFPDRIAFGLLTRR
jgi:SAM-dependent methyltransferase